MRLAIALRQARTVFRKELKDSSRDRRALLAVVFSVLVGPLAIAIVVDRMVDRQRQVEDVRIPVVGAEYGLALVDWLSAQPGVEIAPGPADPERSVREGDEQLVLVIARDFAERFRSSRAAVVRLVSDTSRDDTRPTVARVRDLLQAYSAEMAALRLVARGISPQVVATLRVDDVDVSTPQQRAAAILNFLGVFMLLAALAGGMPVATDSTAGERERGSLEALLVNPVARSALVAGKWLAASVASFIAVVLTMLVCVLLLKLVLAPDLGVRLSLGLPQFAVVLVAALSICPLAAALQALVGTYSRSFKEAQSYMGILMTLPVLAIGVVGAISPLGSETWMYAVPLLSQYTLVTAVVGGTLPEPLAFGLTTTVSLAVSVAMLAMTTRLFRNERIIFGR